VTIAKTLRWTRSSNGKPANGSISPSIIRGPREDSEGCSLDLADALPFGAAAGGCNG
jgi:hypothetical protein